jgi:acyl carrier protein
MAKRESIVQALNTVLAKKQRQQVASFDPSLRLREDLDLDSLDLAELTVQIEAVTGIDIFAEGVVRTLGEIEDRLGIRGGR